MSQSAILWRSIAVIAVIAAALQLRSFLLWRRRQSPAASAALARASAMILEHPQSLGLLIGQALLVPALAYFLGKLAMGLGRHPFGLYAFLPGALALAAAVACSWLATAALTAAFAARRLKGERPTFPVAADAVGKIGQGLVGWALSHVGTAREPTPTPLAFAVVLTEGLFLPEAARRAAALTAQAPQTEEAVRLAQDRLAPVRGVVLKAVLPLCLSCFCLPLVPFVGYKIALLAPFGFERYALFLLVPAAALTAAGLFFSVRIGAGLVHAVAVYLYAASGNPAVRERLAGRFGAAGLWADAPAAASPAPAVPAPPPPQAQPEAPPWEPAQPPPAESYPSQAAPGWGSPQAAPAGPSGDVYDWNQPQPAEPPFPTPAPEWAAARAAGETASRKRSAVSSRALRGLLRAGLIVLLAFSAVAAFRALDGKGLAGRAYLRAWGKPVWGTVERIDAEPRYGALLYRARYAYVVDGRTFSGEDLVAEGAMGRLERRKPVLLRVMVEDPARSCVDDDYGFTAQAAAILALGLGLLLVGGWSFIFRVI